MSRPRSNKKSDILQNLSPRLTKLLDEIKRDELGHSSNDTAYLDDLFRFSSQNKSH